MVGRDSVAVNLKVLWKLLQYIFVDYADVSEAGSPSIFRISSILKTETTYSSETSMSIYSTKLLHVPEARNLHINPP